MEVEESAVSSAEKNKAIVRRFEEELARGNLDVIAELLAPDFIDRALVAGQGPTREDFKRSSEEFLGVFTYTGYTIEEQIAEGDTVVTKFTASGVRRGELARLPPGRAPSGEEETLEGVRIHRISEGKITEEKEIVLEAGDAALFYSDGLVEAHDPRGEMFGFPRLRALVAEHDEKRSLEDFLLEEVWRFTGEDWEQEDDITLLTLRHSAPRS
jgi:ketosteroid isomerase-like protein